MEYAKEVNQMLPVGRCHIHGAAPIPQEGTFTKVTKVEEISGFSHSVGTCGLKQGACKLSLNIKDGIIQEALIEVIGCSGMTQSAAMAAEILPGKTLREFFLAMAYGRTQTAYSQGGLTIGAGLEDLGSGMRSQIGTCYGTLAKGPRYLELTEGYISRLGLDAQDRIIGYQYVNIGKMMDSIENGVPADEALSAATGTYGRFSEAVRTMNPRKQ